MYGVTLRDSYTVVLGAKTCVTLESRDVTLLDFQNGNVLLLATRHILDLAHHNQILCLSAEFALNQLGLDGKAGKYPTVAVKAVDKLDVLDTAAAGSGSRH
jgi:hypothetical protein